MTHITKEEAVESCKEHLIELIRQWEPKYITDKAPEGYYMPAGHKAEAWYIHYPAESGCLKIGASRILAVSKKDGKIICDGFFGE